LFFDLTLHYTYSSIITKHYPNYLFFLLFVAILSSAQSQIPSKFDSIPVKTKNSFIVAPLITNTKETSWAFGAASAYIFRTDRKDTTLRASTIPMGLLYTLNNQIIAGIGANIFLPREEYIFRFESSFSKFPDKFWGLGNNTDSREEDFERYTFTQIFLNPQFYKKIKKNLFVGIGYNIQGVFSIDTNTANPPRAFSYFGKDNVLGIANNPDGKYLVSGFDLIFNFDSRNNAYVPNKGELVRVRISQFYKGIGSDFNFGFLEIDFRKFFKTGVKSSFGINSYMIFNVGDVPFRNLATLGGRNYMRGYYDGRFRDKKYISFQGEYRFPIWWRFGGAAFLGFGQVANSFQDFHFDGFKVSFGGGLRIAILPKEKLNLRVDYGFGIVGSGALSIVLAEAF
jgi:outer membrane protein assembly factor BamA